MKVRSEAMVDENLLDQMQNDFTHMKNAVRLILFTKDVGCETCPEAVKLVRSIKARAPKIALEVYDQVMDRDKAEQYGVKYVPATVVQAANRTPGPFLRPHAGRFF